MRVRQVRALLFKAHKQMEKNYENQFEFDLGV